MATNDEIRIQLDVANAKARANLVIDACARTMRNGAYPVKEISFNGILAPKVGVVTDTQFQALLANGWLAYDIRAKTTICQCDLAAALFSDTPALRQSVAMPPPAEPQTTWLPELRRRERKRLEDEEARRKWGNIAAEADAAMAADPEEAAAEERVRGLMDLAELGERFSTQAENKLRWEDIPPTSKIQSEYILGALGENKPPAAAEPPAPITIAGRRKFFE